MAGARPAAPIAAAWAILKYLGAEGYERLAARIIEAVRILREGIERIPELEIIGTPEASILAFGSSELVIMAVGDALDDRGWCADRQKDPEALHLMVSPEHDRVAESFVQDLRQAVRARGSSRGKQARYN